MTVERTLSILKPDAVMGNLVGSVCSLIEAASLHIVAARMLSMRNDEVEQFYAAHRTRAFFPDLVEYMRSGPVLAMVLQGEDAISRYRQLMGATRPEDAEPGTIRQRYGVCSADSRILRNVVHGSDSQETAEWEIGFFFSRMEQFPRE